MLSPAWLLDLAIRNPRRRFAASEVITGVLLLPVFTMLGTAVMAVVPTTGIVVVWLFLSHVIGLDVRTYAYVALYLVFLFSAGWGFGLGLRDISRSIDLGWRVGGDEILAEGYTAYRKRTGRWA